MSHIYYIWKNNETYIGLDSGDDYKRIQDHIVSVLDPGSRDSARQLIKEVGVTNVAYGIFPPSDGSLRWGIPDDVFKHFKKTWIATDDLQLAEILHIIWAKIWGVTLHNITVGGQLTGGKVYYANDTDLTIHLRDWLEDWERVRRKILYPEQYGFLKKIVQEALMKEYREPSFWQETLAHILKNPNASYKQLEEKMLKSTRKALINAVEKHLGQAEKNKYIHYRWPLNLSGMVKDYFFWVKSKVINNDIKKELIDKLIYTGWGIKDSSRKNDKVKKDVFVFSPSSLYSEFTEPKQKPLWYQKLSSTKPPIPKIWSGEDTKLQNKIKEASFKVFSTCVKNAISGSFDRTATLRSKVADQYNKLGVDVNKFFHDWYTSYSYLISAWTEDVNKNPLVPTQQINEKTGDIMVIHAANALEENPEEYYWMTQWLSTVIASVKSLKDVPYNFC